MSGTPHEHNINQMKHNSTVLTKHNAISGQQQMFEDFFTSPFNRTAYLGPQIEGHELRTSRYKLIANFRTSTGTAAFTKYMQQRINPDLHRISVRTSDDYTGDTKFDQDKQYFSLCVSTKEQNPEILFHAISHYAQSEDYIGLSFGYLPSFDLGNIHDFLRTYAVPVNLVINHIDVIGDKVTSNANPIKSNEVMGCKDFYPFIEEGHEKLIRDFYASKSNLMILTGVWGSGKSTLMRSMINYNEGSFFLIDNPDNYSNPDKFSLLINYIRANTEKDKHVTLFLEEADAFVQQKTSDNPTLSRLLSMSSGVLVSNIKIVIATNLSNKTKLDKALTRPGRAFRCVDFRELTPDEANNARSAINLDRLPFTEKITLAVALNNQTEVDLKTNKSQGFGFISSQ